MCVWQVSQESGQPVEWMKEDNYMFRLSHFAADLHKWLDKGGMYLMHKGGTYMYVSLGGDYKILTPIDTDDRTIGAIKINI